MNPKRRVVLVAPFDGKPHLYLGYLKAYVDSLPDLAAAVETRVLHVENYTATGPILALDPDLVAFAPVEDRPIQTLYQACAQLKAAKPSLPILLCAEDPRNRIRFSDAFQKGIADFAIHGYGEKPFGELLGHLWLGRAKTSVGGVVFSPSLETASRA